MSSKVNGKKCSNITKDYESLEIPKNKKEEFRNAVQVIKSDDLLII